MCADQRRYPYFNFSLNISVPINIGVNGEYLVEEVSITRQGILTVHGLEIHGSECSELEYKD